jgi:hypothetical protein
MFDRGLPLSSIKDMDELTLSEFAKVIQDEAENVKTLLESQLNTEALQTFNEFYWRTLFFTYRVSKETE